MPKGFAQPIVILLILTAILGAIYYVSFPKKNSLVNPKTVSQNEQKKTYTNQNLNFELKYSPELNLKEDSEEEFNKRGNGNYRKNFKTYLTYEPGKFLGAAVVLDKSNSYDANPFTVWVFDNPDDLTIDEWYKNYWYYPFVWGDFTYSGKTTLAPKDEATISGQIGKVGVVNYQPGKPKFIYLSDNKKMYLFRIIGNLGDQILFTFKLPEVKNTEGCKVGGCSGQLCIEEGKGGISTCEWIEEYACYKGAKCERQSNSECGWTQTEQLAKCLKEVRL